MIEIEESELSNFSICKWMQTKLHLSGNKLIVYAYIYSFSKDGMNKYYGTIDTICENTGASKRTVIRCLEELTQEGLIVKEKAAQNGKYNAYRDKTAVGFIEYYYYYASITRGDNAGFICTSTNKNKKYSGTSNVNYSNTGDKMAPATGDKMAPATGDKMAPATGDKMAPATGDKMAPNNTINNTNNNTTTYQAVVVEEQSPLKIIYEKIKALYDGHYVFKDNLLNKYFDICNELEINMQKAEEYLEFAFNHVTEYKPEHHTNCFEKYILNIQNLQNYLITHKNIIQDEKLLKDCPVCNSKIRENTLNCPVCDCDLTNKDTQYIKIQKKIWLLPEKQKTDFQRKMDQYTNRILNLGYKYYQPEVRELCDKELYKIYKEFEIVADDEEKIKDVS